MLKRRTPLQRGNPMARGSGFARPVYERQPVVATPAPAGLADRVRTGPAELRADPKPPERLRSEPYRRLVAAFPCWLCGRPGRSQFAHRNEGKGTAAKVDDREGGPLCADEPGRQGCHMLLDQSGRLPRPVVRELMRQMAADTRAEVLALGAWPAGLPLWVDPVEKFPAIGALRQQALRLVGGIAIAAAALGGTAQAAEVCDWNNPGSNPTTVPAATIVARLPDLADTDGKALFTPEIRTALGSMVAQGAFRTRVFWDGSQIVGAKLKPLGMSFGAGVMCIGKIETSRWTPGARQWGWAYMVGRASVVHWDRCNNITPAINLDALAPALSGLALRDARREADTPAVGGARGEVHTAPEPSSFWLGLLALVAMLWLRKRGGR